MTRRCILITGATGGLGQALVREARRRRHRVIATGRSNAAATALEALGAEFRRCDLEAEGGDLASLAEGCDSIIHAAALSASWGPREAFVSANLTVTQRLLAAARNAAVERFVFVSSPSIHASYADRLGITEGDPPAPAPLNHYAETKLAAERLVLGSSDEGLSCCAIRPRALVGEGDQVILPRLAQLARRPRMPLPRGGKALIELTDLRDAARAICEAEERAPVLGGEAINISGGAPVSVREVATRLAEALSTNPRLLPLPMPIARLIASASEAWARVSGAEEEPVLTRYTLATLGYSQTFDLFKAQRLLDYSPRHDALATLLEHARRLKVQEERP